MRNQALNSLGDLDEDTEGDQFGDLPLKPPAHLDAVGMSPVSGRVGVRAVSALCQSHR